MRKIALVSLLVATASAASTSVSVGSMSVDGMEVRDLSCELTSGGMFASMLAVSSLAKQKSAFDACHPEGAAYAVSWTWTGGKTTDAKLVKASVAGKETCVQAALTAVTADLAGTCTATVLGGAGVAAAAGLEKLTPAE